MSSMLVAAPLFGAEETSSKKSFNFIFRKGETMEPNERDSKGVRNAQPTRTRQITSIRAFANRLGFKRAENHTTPLSAGSAESRRLRVLASEFGSTLYRGALAAIISLNL